MPPRAASAAEEALGIEPAVYSFLGAGAYPAGWLAVLHGPTSPTCPNVYTAFDSGSLHRPFVRRDVSPRWDELPERVRFLREHEGSGGVSEYAARFIAAHFSDPLDYVRRLRGTPDHRAYHGLSDCMHGGVIACTWTHVSRRPEAAPAIGLASRAT